MYIPATKTSNRIATLLLLVAVLVSASCSVIVRDYPANRPFVYESGITLQGKFTTAERKQLINQLEQQLHDSVRPRTVQKLIFFTYMDRPPSYDTLNVGKSVVYLRALLTSLGYYHDTIVPVVRIDTLEDQHRATVDFQVTPGRLTRLDSVWYSMGKDTTGARPGNDTLQRVTLDHTEQSLLKKGNAFSKPLISAERDRLADLYRNNGFLRFSSEEIVAVWDTVDVALLRPTLDPIEQAQLMEALRLRRENPTADVEMRLRPNRDTSHLVRYYNGNVTIYPDLGPDTALYVPQHFNYNGNQIISYTNSFSPRMLGENVFMRKGELYVQRNYLRTLNRFNSLGSWRLVTIDQVPRPGTDTVDFNIKMTPAEKYHFSANLEASRNVAQAFVEGGLLGFGVNLRLQNRNFARGANQANTNFRFGTELGTDTSSRSLVQSIQAIFSHSIIFPRVIPRWNLMPKKWRENARTTLNFNVGNIDRISYFNVTSFSTSLGYETSWKNNLVGIRFPNIEYNYLVRRPQLEELIKSNASYKYIFNTGLVSSILFNISNAGSGSGYTRLLRGGLELSAPLSGFIKGSKFLDSNLYRFGRVDLEYRRTKTIRRTAFAWRGFMGIGVGLPRSPKDSNNRFLPFFRQYYAGGPNSMRAWGLRKLGPGSRIASFNPNIAPDRFGDFQLEANAEYRFFVTDLKGYIINSALFVDVGNVWYLRDDPSMENENFRFHRLWHDLGIGAGTGLRIDLSFIKIRLDYAYKIKNPSPDRPGEGQWIKHFKPLEGQLQFGIDYPF
jgi:outer membrane protein insertion porin family